MVISGVQLTNLRSQCGRARNGNVARRARGRGSRSRIATIMTFHQACPDNGNPARFPADGRLRTNWIFRVIDIWYTIQLTEGAGRVRCGANRGASAGTGRLGVML
jgi:hypothetical protein